MYIFFRKELRCYEWNCIHIFHAKEKNYLFNDSLSCLSYLLFSRFFLAADTTGELWLSSDETEKNLKKVVAINGWTAHNEWLK